MTQPTPRRGPIIVVDDDPEIRSLLRELLDLEGFRVIAVANGREALETAEAQETTPALFLLDLMMPDMDGLDFRTAQLASPRLAEVPIVVMSGDTRMGEKVAAMQAQESLAKPFELDPLIQVVERYVERTRAVPTAPSAAQPAPGGEPTHR